jgi:hypothetical protein
VQPLKYSPAFYGARRFNTVFTIPSYLRSILILSTHLRLGLPSGLFPFSVRSWITNILNYRTQVSFRNCTDISFSFHTACRK